MPARSTVNEVLSCLANRGMDSDGLSSSDWLKLLQIHDLAELVVMICKRRNEPAYAPLVTYLINCIEAEQAEMP
jgi:hypothetical protein